MKNIFKLSGIIVLVAIIGFLFAACGGGGGDGDTYTAGAFSISYATYAQVINDLGDGYSAYLDVTKLIDAPKEQARIMYYALEEKNNSGVDDSPSVSLSEIKAYMKRYTTDDSLINTITEKATSQGYALAGMDRGPSFGNGIIGCERL